MKKILKFLSPMITAAICGVFLLMAVSKWMSYSSYVNVRGLCEREVKADRVIYPIKFREIGDDVVALNASVNQKKQIVAEFLKSYGLTEEEFLFSSPRVEDAYTNSYTTNAKARYTLETTVTIYSQKIDTVLSIQSNLSELVEKGIAISIGESWENPVQYLFEGLNDIKPAMIADATANARIAAEKFAVDSHSKVGKIKSASQGYFSIEARDNYTPYIKRVRVVTDVTFYLR